MACGPVPEGYSRWTLRLLEEKARVELDVPIGKDAIRLAQKNELRPHKNAYGCIPSKENAEFIACMEDILDIYEMPYDSSYPDRNKIILVMDNLNTHAISSLYKAFPAPGARRLAKRPEIHYIPKHGSWRHGKVTAMYIRLVSNGNSQLKMPGVRVCPWRANCKKANPHKAD